MSTDFKQISSEDFSNVFNMVDKDWMLVTAGNLEKYNMMTASWGGFGIFWHKRICFIVIRPQRYTLEFIENTETFTLNFLPEEFRKELTFNGKNSGRDVNKMEQTSLTPVATENNSVYFEESKIVLECKRLYSQDMDPKNFIDQSLDQAFYPNKDYHRIIYAEIVNLYEKK